MSGTTDEAGYEAIAAWAAEQILHDDPDRAELGRTVFKWGGAVAGGAAALIEPLHNVRLPRGDRIRWRNIILTAPSTPEHVTQPLMQANGPWTSDPISEGFTRRFTALEPDTARAWAPSLRARLAQANPNERALILECFEHPALGDAPAND